MNKIKNDEMEKYAKIVGNYRYLLGRKWDENLQQVTFVMLNPSTADHENDDQTLRKCIHFAKSWGYGSLEVVNLFAYRATKPNKLKTKNINPVGPDNNQYILSAIERAEKIILAWGSWLDNVSISKYPIIKNRDKEVLTLIKNKKPLYCLRITKHGHPNHPVYLPKNINPIIFPARE